MFWKQKHRKKSLAFCHSFRFYEKYGIRKQNLYVPKGTQRVENSRTKFGTTISAHISQALQLPETKTSKWDRIQEFFTLSTLIFLNFLAARQRNSHIQEKNVYQEKEEEKKSFWEKKRKKHMRK